MTGFGACSSLPPIPAKLASPNRQRSFMLGGGNWSSYPFADLYGGNSRSPDTELPPFL